MVSNKCCNVLTLVFASLARDMRDSSQRIYQLRSLQQDGNAETQSQGWYTQATEAKAESEERSDLVY